MANDWYASKWASMDLTAAPRYRDYVRRFKPKPGGPFKPLSREDWEARVLGKPKDKDEGSKDTKPQSVKKWAPKVKAVMEKHDLTDDDAEQVKAFKNKKPSSGVKLSPQQLMQRFMAEAKPETKKRMKGMTPNEFMAMLAAIMDDEGAMKMASRSMYASLVQLGVENPDLRPHIRPVLRRLAMEFATPEALKKYLQEELGGGKRATLGRRAHSGKVQLRDNGYKVIYPDPYGQTYDSYLIDHKNPKTVQALAMRALADLRNKPGLTSWEVEDYVNKYVAENTKGRWSYVIWNSKSYPD